MTDPLKLRAALTKREKGILYAASRKCGLSYRSACTRGIDVVRGLRKDGYLKMTDNGKDLGRFVFWITPEGSRVLEIIGEKK